MAVGTGHSTIVWNGCGMADTDLMFLYPLTMKAN